MFNKMDSINIGTIGFAQVGNPTYDEKIKIEKQVLNELYAKEEFAVPTEFKEFARFKWRLNPHDFGSYWDLEIYYNRNEVESWEDEEEDDILTEKFHRFWDWANKAEDALCTNEEELEELMDQLYQKTITMEVVHKDLETKKTGLKAV